MSTKTLMERVTAGESRQRTGEGVSPVVSKCGEYHSGVAARTFSETVGADGSFAVIKAAYVGTQ